MQFHSTEVYRTGTRHDNEKTEKITKSKAFEKVIFFLKYEMFPEFSANLITVKVGLAGVV